MVGNAGALIHDGNGNRIFLLVTSIINEPVFKPAVDMTGIRH